MADYNELPVTDPDNISFAAAATTINAQFTANTDDELLIDYTNRKIGLKVQGTLFSDGITLKAVYSKLKDAWKDNATLIRFPFPMVPITDEQFQLVNGWNFDQTETSGESQTTVDLIRSGGWQVLNTATPAAIVEEWVGIISLGDLPSGTQVYYDQTNDETSAAGITNFKLTRKVNQAVQTYLDTNGDGSADFNYRSYFKMFVREWQRTYSSSDFTAIGVSTSTYQAYRFPLTNIADLKVPHAEAIVSDTGISATASSDGTSHTYTVAAGHGIAVGEKISLTDFGTAAFNVTNLSVTAISSTTVVVTPVTPATNGASDTGGTLKMPVFSTMTITYSRDSGDGRVLIEDIKGDWVSGTVYAIGDVVKSGSDGEWYIVIDPTTAGDTTDPSTDVTNYAAYAFDREISSGAGTFFAFNVVVDADTGTALFDQGGANTVEIYEFTQYKLRQGSDIDTSSPGDVIGKTANQLLTFVGDTLVTGRGVYIDSFESTDINSITFTDYANVAQAYDFVAFLTINFGDNLVAEDNGDTVYKVFFKTSDDGNFGDATAELVETNTTGVFMTGSVDGQSSVSLSYNYDGNIQRGSGTGGTDVTITAVAIGLGKAQYVKSEAVIARSKTNSVSLIAALERNYQA